MASLSRDKSSGCRRRQLEAIDGKQPGGAPLLMIFIDRVFEEPFNPLGQSRQLRRFESSTSLHVPAAVHVCLTPLLGQASLLIKIRIKLGSLRAHSSRAI